MIISGRKYKSFYLPESRSYYPRSRDFHTEHIKLEISVDLKRRMIEGRASLRIVPLKQELRHVALDACAMDVRSVELDAVGCDYEHEDEKLVINPRSPLEKKSHVVVVEYISKPSKGLYFIQPDNAYPEKEIQVWTHSEPESARYWYPCYDYPNDKSTSETIVTVPEGFVVISNGKLLGVTRKDGLASYHWREETPHSSYLNSFIAGKFEEIKEKTDGTELYYYFPKEKRNDVVRYFGETPRMIEVFEELTGTRYPYARYSQTTVQDFVIGGMENISATTLAMRYYPDQRSEEDFQATYSRQSENAVNLVAHELAHQWFGDLVTCGDWSQIWLNEAFATYLQCLYLERTRGPDFFRWDLALKAEVYFEEDEEKYRRPIVERNFVFPDDVFDRTTYQKGAWMIHQLRYVLGDEVFFQGIQEYMRKFSGRNADTHDFRKVLEEVSGQSLEEYFEEFFYKAGYPEFDVDYSWEEKDSRARVSIKQIQKTDDETPLFRLPCELVFYTAGGRKQKRVFLSTAEETFSFELDSRPTVVEFDPGEWILKKVTFKKSFDLLANQLRESIDASSRAGAATQLGLMKSNQAVQVLRDAANKEQFWFVRVKAIEALGEIGTEEALGALVGLDVPENRRVRRAMAKAFGEFKDRRAIKMLDQFLLHDPSPYVQCEAALSLGKVDEKEALQKLMQAMKIESPNSTLTEACLDAMGKIKEENVRNVIKENLVYGMPTRARIGALKAIVNRGFAYEDEVAVLKELLLRDGEVSVRHFVVNEVIPTLVERRLLDALKTSSVSDQDNRIRRRALEVYYDLTESVETISSIVKLRQEVDKLKEENRELRGRVGARNL